MINKKLPRWFSYIWVFIFLILMWVSLVASASPRLDVEAGELSPLTGVLNPGSTTFGITIGAVVLVAIILTNIIIKNQVRG